MGDRYDDLERMALGQHAGAAPPQQRQGTGVGKWAPSNFAPNPGRLATAQSQLARHGFPIGHPVNGHLTPGTTKAIAGFQRAQGLTPTGTLDSGTISALQGPPSPAKMGAAVGNRLRGGPVRVTGHTMTPAHTAPATLARPTTQAGAPPGPAAPSRSAWLGAPVPAAASASLGSTKSAWLPPGAKQGHATAPAAQNQGKNHMAYESAGKRVPVSFSSTGTVPAASPVDIVVTPQIAFRGECWVVDATTAANFSLRQIKVGTLLQSGGGSGDIPMSTFPGTQTAAVAYEMDLCNAGTQITVTVVNTDTTAAHAFAGTLWGHEIQLSQ